MSHQLWNLPLPLSEVAFSFKSSSLVNKAGKAWESTRLPSHPSLQLPTHSALSLVPTHNLLTSFFSIKQLRHGYVWTHAFVRHAQTWLLVSSARDPTLPKYLVSFHWRCVSWLLTRSSLGIQRDWFLTVLFHNKISTHSSSLRKKTKNLYVTYVYSPVCFKIFIDYL